MGEYHSVMTGDNQYDQPCKLGTMDDWRYVRRSEAEQLALVDAGKGANIPRALTHPNVLYRFPWPDEDAYAGQTGHIAERDMFRTYTVPVPHSLMDALDHRSRWVSMGAANQGGAYNVNVALPCPLSPAFREGGFQNSGATPILQLLGERVDAHGHTRTIFGCGYCEQMYALGEDSLALLQEILRATRPSEPWYADVAARLKARPVSLGEAA
jgi:hypothetical protein